jgi:hypothetical protein
MRTDTERLVADLNDLLKLDHDAIAAYTIAIENLGNPSYRQSLESYRGDHERHVREIAE